MSTVPSDVKGEALASSSQGRCRLCMGAAHHAFVASDLNRRTSEERFAYSICGSCGTYFLVDVPNDMSRYYPEEYYELPSAEALDAAARSERYKIEMLLDRGGS